MLSQRLRSFTQRHNLTPILGWGIVLSIVADILAICASVVSAFVLRFDGRIPSEYLSSGFPVLIGAMVALTIPIFFWTRMYAVSWRHISIAELSALGRSTLISFLASGALLLLVRDHPLLMGFPRSVFVMSYIVFFLLAGAVRIAPRWTREKIMMPKSSGGGAKTLIVGAGDEGVQILRSMLVSGSPYHHPVGFVDENPQMWGRSIQGLRIFGGIEDIPHVVKRYLVEEIIIALPSSGSGPIKRAVEFGRGVGVLKIKVVPPMSEILDGEVSIRTVREVQVEDLLGRAPISITQESVERFIGGKRVLITGGAGSIGSELARQVARFKPSILAILDQDETRIFETENELKAKFPLLGLVGFVGDVRDRERMGRVFLEVRPQVVFHAAAYKHVPLMESHPDEAVKNNVMGTLVVGELAVEHVVETFVFISTDKAVNPTSVMGATKRVGEMICEALNRAGNTAFISVRFGNVLNSRGSVLPLFRKQIEQGGPVRVTHPDMKRYFMLSSEACVLVLQAAALGKGGEVFVLDMGNPVRILDLAREVIRLSGLEPDKDIPIVFTGVRPGEKLFEDLLAGEEGVLKTNNEKIFMAKAIPSSNMEFWEAISAIHEAAGIGDHETVRRMLHELVPSYQ